MQVLRKGYSAWLELRNVSPMAPLNPWQSCWPQPSKSMILYQLLLLSRFWTILFQGEMGKTVHCVDRSLTTGPQGEASGVSPMLSM